MIDTITTTYEWIADMLREDYKLEKMISVKTKERKQSGIRFHVNPIVFQESCDYVKSLFAGMGLNISYTDEYIYIEIPE